MPRGIALMGGEEFRPGCEELDYAILASVEVERPRLLVLPTAAAHENPAMATSNGVRYFSELGADAAPLMALDRADAEDQALAAEVEAADVVYLTGGNPSYLLDTLQGTMLLRGMTAAHGRGAVLAGSSAGAMVLGAWMRFRGWREALGIAGSIATLPHHERAHPESVAAELAADAPPGLTAVLGIDARTGCLGTADGWTVLGAGQVAVYQGGAWRRRSSGESFTT
jgi:cyanophycinase